MREHPEIYDEHRDFLWGYCYRVTGNAADAEDIVQETFVRAIERPPADTTRPWRPWLVRVASNLARDALRRRRRRRYTGPWLPSPVAFGDAAPEPVAPDDTASRYDTLESVSVAFLLALEALTPLQRLVLVLRDVYDYSVEETAQALDKSPGSVKTTHHRARRALEGYDAERRPPSPLRTREVRAALERFLAALATRDVGALRAVLADDVELRSDADGRFYSARRPVVGAEKVALFFSRIAPPPDEEVRIEIRSLNGQPALVGERPAAPGRFARRFVITVDVDDAGRIRRFYNILSPEKLVGACSGE